MDNGIEKEILREIARREVVNYEELAHFLEGKTDNPTEVIPQIAKSLNERGLIIYVSPIGQRCLAITQKGMREANAREEDKNGRNREQNGGV